MTETVIDSLVVKVRADVSDLKDQLADVKQDFIDLERVGRDVADELGRSFENFSRSGKLSFSGLRDLALSVLQDIASSAIRSGINGIFGSGSGGSGFFGDILGSLFGRAGGGTVAPNRPFLVGERGPELFVPHTAGRITAPGGGQGSSKVTNITVNVNNQNGAPDTGRRSAGQIALAVRRAVSRAERDA